MPKMEKQITSYILFFFPNNYFLGLNQRKTKDIATVFLKAYQLICSEKCFKREVRTDLTEFQQNRNRDFLVG